MPRRPGYLLKPYKKRVAPLWPWVLAGVAIPLAAWLIWNRYGAAWFPKPGLTASHVGKKTAEPVPDQPRTNRVVLTRTNATTVGTQMTIPATPPSGTNLSTAAISAAPVRRGLPEFAPSASGDYPRQVQSIFQAQVALARQHLSPGSLDGLMGSQTRAAVRAFQLKAGLRETGELDEATCAALTLDSPPVTNVAVAADLLATLQPLSKTWLGKSQQSALAYESLLECLAERAQSHPALLRRLNPSYPWDSPALSLMVQVPAVTATNSSAKAATVRILLRDRALRAYDQQGTLLAHFPCSIAQRMEKRPVGELHVQVIIPNPNYTFDPEVFPESTEGRQLGRKLILPPGPNNPVGVAWIGLDRPGYGIHGTPGPEQVGRTESHGCFRLANWNAEYLVSLSWIGMPVFVEP